MNSHISSKTKIMMTEMAAEIAELKGKIGHSLADVAADWLMPEYVQTAQEQLESAATGEDRHAMLQTMIRDVAVARRGDHSSARVALRQSLLTELRRQREEEEKRQNERNENKGGLTQETLEKIERELKLL